MPHVVIANRLRDGIVVFLGTSHQWVEKLSECSPAQSEAEEEALIRLGQEASDRQEIVDPTLIEVEEKEGVLHAVKMREAMRAMGPTVREDLGKQAEN
ncbi:MAG: nitrite reductase [Spirochaeta sp.]|nr:nitrite reductase [Spirochaeta sp.]RPG12652.1 MAG: DUF2849 domain-containing protein [Proteobacteria bacterium TMED72]